jgi:hypothetical protein
MRARASEFPNDNPALHRGAVWVMNEPCGDWEVEAGLATPTPGIVAAEATATPAPTTTTTPTATPTPTPISALVNGAPSLRAMTLLPPAFEDEPGDDIEIVDELEPIDLDPLSDPDDPFADFIRMLVEVAVEAGCDKAAAILPALLEEGRIAPGVLSTAVTEALLLNGMLARTDAGIVGGESLRRTAAAWRAILRGDSEDFSSCGPRMLDEWAAELVACLALTPAKSEGLRRKLRTRGVAAFGLVAA